MSRSELSERRRLPSDCLTESGSRFRRVHLPECVGCGAGRHISRIDAFLQCHRPCQNGNGHPSTFNLSSSLDVSQTACEIFNYTNAHVRRPKVKHSALHLMKETLIDFLSLGSLPFQISSRCAHVVRRSSQPLPCMRPCHCEPSQLC